MRIQTMQMYLYQDTLVTCVGATFGDEDNPTRYHIRWQDDDGAHEEKVLADELRLAPTLIEMKRRYDDALQVVYRQAKRIEELETKIAVLEGKEA